MICTSEVRARAEVVVVHKATVNQDYMSVSDRFLISNAVQHPISFDSLKSPVLSESFPCMEPVGLYSAAMAL